MPLRLSFPSAPEGSRAAADTVVTGMTEVGTAAPGLEMPPCRGIPNLGGKPARFAAVCPTQIRYTFLSHGGGKDQLKLNGIGLWSPVKQRGTTGQVLSHIS